MMNWNAQNSHTAAVHVNVRTQAELLEDLSKRFSDQRGFTVATLNLDHAVKLRKDPAFAAAYAAHSHITSDGNPVVWINRLAGQSDFNLIPGSELILPMCDLAANLQIPIALFGATQSSLDAAADVLKATFPKLNIALCLAPPMGFDPEGPTADEAIVEIQQSGAGLVFLALGAPKQERFAVRANATIPTAGFLSIGAGLDFISGRQTRAPQWVRKLSMEWVWRMLGNPRRLALRYGACILILPSLTLRALSTRRKTSSIKNN